MTMQETSTFSIARAAIQLDGILSKHRQLVESDTEKREAIAALQREMNDATAAMVDGTFDPAIHRELSKIAAEIKRRCNSVDKGLDDTYELLGQAAELRNSLIEALESITLLN